MRANQKGQGLTEYVVVLCFVATVLIFFLRKEVKWYEQYNSSNTQFDSNLIKFFPNIISKK